MKSLLYFFTVLSFGISGFQATIKAQAAITVSATNVAAATIAQGTNYNIVYAVKMDVATSNATVNNVHFTLTGTHDANDLSGINVFYNPNTPTVSGAATNNGTNAVFAGPHTYDIPVNTAITAGSTGYFIITVSLSSSATDANTIHIDGAANPVTFGYTTSPNVTNSQTNAAGIQTITASDITLSSSAVAAANIAQGTNYNVVYVVKMDVATKNVTVNNVHFTLTGTHDANDLSGINIFYNPNTPTVSGAATNNGTTAVFAGPHTYDIPVNTAITAGSTGYFIITVSLSSSATDANTIHIDGAANPVTFGYTTSPNVTNSQTNAAGIQTITASDITLSSSAVAAANIAQGTNYNVVYVVKMDVATKNVTVNNVHFTLTGTHDANDLSGINIFYNPNTPTVSGAATNNGTTAVFAGPHTYDIPVNTAITAGSTGYFIITVSLSSSATDANTIHIDGATDPVTFGYTTSPNVTNSQVNAAGIQTITASDITLSSSAVAAANIAQGTNYNVVYVVKMDVATKNVTVNNVHFTLTGTHDANDLSGINIFYNPNTPTVSGAATNNGTTAVFAGPHTYDIPVNTAITAGSTGYFIITVSLSSSATDANTIHIDGAANPVTFGYTTSPNVTNSETNAAGIQTITASDITLSSVVVPAGNIAPGINYNVVYIIKMDVATENILVNNVHFTLTGTHDANDFTGINVFYNPNTPTVSGAATNNGTTTIFAGPHTYDVPVNTAIVAGASGYFLVTVSTAGDATIGNTVHIDGAASPVSFGYSTTPNLSNSQTNIAGVKTIGSILPVTLVSFSAKMVSDKVQLDWITATEINNAFFEIERSSDGIHFIPLGSVNGNGNSSSVQRYSFTDGLPQYGSNYYRLKQTDIDNHFRYSNVAEVSFIVKTFTLNAIYPNPVKNLLHYSLISPDNKKMQVRVTDISGKILMNSMIVVNKGTNPMQLNVASFESGIYQLTVTDPVNKTAISRQLIIVQ